MKVLVFDRMEECTEAEVQRLIPLVSEQRREQALRFKHTFGQFCCLKSWLMLRDLLDEPMKGLIERWEYNEYGKPYLPNGPFFSLSHCKEGIAVAIDVQPIGIDIEAVRKADEDLMKRTMNEDELRLIADADAERTFTRFWTQKEAVVKAEGVGIRSFEQLQHVLENTEWRVESVQTDRYIYSIACKS